MGKQVYKAIDKAPHALHLSDGTTTLKGATSVTEAADGTITFTGIPGGAATLDINDAPHVVWRATDVDGEAAAIADGEFFRSLLVWMHEAGSPDTSGDSYIGIALVDDNDLTVANGAAWALVYTGATTSIRCFSVIAGTSTGSNTVGVVDRLMGSVAQLTDAALWYGHTAGYDGNWTLRIKSQIIGAFPATIGDLYWVVYAGRTAATAGAVTLASRPFITPTNGMPGPL